MYSSKQGTNDDYADDPPKGEPHASGQARVFRSSLADLAVSPSRHVAGCYGLWSASLGTVRWLSGRLNRTLHAVQDHLRRRISCNLLAPELQRSIREYI